MSAPPPVATPRPGLSGSATLVIPDEPARPRGPGQLWLVTAFFIGLWVKGWAIARAAALLDEHGYRDYYVDAAGDVRTRGIARPGCPGAVGIRHPVERDKSARVVLATDLAVATSGTYEKGAQIYDPHTGQPATALLSLTVIGPSILDADVFTAAFAMGLRGLDFIASRAGYEAYAVDPDLRAHWTRCFEAYADR